MTRGGGLLLPLLLRQRQGKLKTTNILQRRQLVRRQFSQYVRRDSFIVVSQDVADAGDIPPGDFRISLFDLVGKWRLASEMISTPRSTSQRVSQLPSKASRVMSRKVVRIRSMASTISMSRGEMVRAMVRRREWPSPRSAFSNADADC